MQLHTSSSAMNRFRDQGLPPSDYQAQQQRMNKSSLAANTTSSKLIGVANTSQSNIGTDNSQIIHRSKSHRSAQNIQRLSDRDESRIHSKSSERASKHVSHTDRSSRMTHEPILPSRQMMKKFQNINSSSLQDIHRQYNDQVNVINGNSQVIKISTSDPTSLIGSGRRNNDEKPVIMTDESQQDQYQQQDY